MRWGVLGTGGIAQAFTTAMHRHTDSRVVAVGSRSADRGAAFATRFGVTRSYAADEPLVADPDVQAVYVASPHSEHHRQAMLAIAAGRPVLVEKAFARNAAEAGEVADAARRAGVLAVEAMWTRFLPQTQAARQLLADGVLGVISTVLADHGQYFVPDAAHRLFDPALAGGALLDLGIYPISLASMVLGTPTGIAATGSKAFTGVEGQVSAVLDHGEAHAVLSTTLAAQTPTLASVSGSAARLEWGGPFYAPGTLTLTSVAGQVLVRPVDPITDSGALAHEAAHVAELITEGRTESPLLPLEETVSIMITMDEIRRQIGVSFPGEPAPVGA